MTDAKRWPKNAEAARLDGIAKARKIRQLQRQIADELAPILNGQADRLTAIEIARRVAMAINMASEASITATEIESQLREVKGETNH
jgi:hypothetical protein